LLCNPQVLDEKKFRDTLKELTDMELVPLEKSITELRERAHEQEEAMKEQDRLIEERVLEKLSPFADRYFPSPPSPRSLSRLCPTTPPPLSTFVCV
jgi:hypothetical protein